MKIFTILLLLAITLGIKARGMGSVLARPAAKTPRSLNLPASGLDNDWMKSTARKLGLSDKDLEADFGEINPSIEQNDAFQAAWREFQSSAEPSLRLFSQMNEKITKQLETVGNKKQNSKIPRKLEGDNEKTAENDGETDKKEESTNDKEEIPEKNDKEEVSEKSEDTNNDNITEDAANDEGNKHSKPKVHQDDIITRLKKRVEMINDKVDHLLFHNHHDLGGVTAHYTPYGVQLLPSYKGEDSIDQKLKAIDYMHTLGGGYNPMLHTLLPYYLGHKGGDKGIKMPAYMRKLSGGSKKNKIGLNKQ